MIASASSYFNFGDVQPAQWCQAYFLLAGAGVLVVAALPSTTSKLLIDYGARNSRGTDKQGDAGKKGWLDKVVAKLTTWGQIPHSWFISFYIAYLACSLMWAMQYFQDGRIINSIAASQASVRSNSMTLGQVFITWALMALQGLRRLYEQVFIKPSKSRMWFVHWLLGLSFYVCMSVAVWVEGSESITSDHIASVVQNSTLAKAIVGILVFLLAWAKQYQYHAYLTNLKKYTLPESGMFRYIVCPHYTCECLLYLSLAVVAAPEGQLCNRTLLCALIFVSINLGVTANGTKKWYAGEFGAEKVARWRMMPLVF